MTTTKARIRVDVPPAKRFSSADDPPMMISARSSRDLVAWSASAFWGSVLTWLGFPWQLAFGLTTSFMWVAFYSVMPVDEPPLPETAPTRRAYRGPHEPQR